MTSFPIRLTLAGLALSFATTAIGQSGDWYVAPSLIWNDDGEYRAIDDSVSGVQVNVGRTMTQHLSLEGLLGYSSISGYCYPGDCYPDQKHLDIGANLLAFYNRDWVFAPYALVGVGFLNVSGEEGPLFVRDSGLGNGATASYGAGLVWRLGGSKYSIRTEFRTRVPIGDRADLIDRLWTIGLQYDLGRQATDPGTPESNIDTDGDGVLDMWDECEYTPPGVTVTSRGCELVNIDRDEDGDRVFDSADECPGTPIGAPVDQRGCSLDSDMDGVSTADDRCPGTRAGAEVNRYGCDNDDDGDEISNHRDRCPDTKTGARVDVNGCEIKDVISLPGANFKTGLDTLLPGAQYVLQEAGEILKRYPEMQIEVAGHTDDVGDASSNQGLSERRAKTVRNYLIQFGITDDRLTYKGYGESQPITDNTTAEGRATNRRVELRLVTQ